MKNFFNSLFPFKVNTNNYKYVIYEVPSGNEMKDKSLLENVTWNQWSSIYGEEVLGIWPSGTQQDYINCAHLAPYSSKLATGDDMGNIKLFNFPCLENNVSALKNKYSFVLLLLY